MSEFKLMLACGEMPDLSAIDYPRYMQIKIDGYRAVYKPDEGFISRSGKTFRNKEIIKYFDCLNNQSEYILDGELYIPNVKFQDLASTISKEGAEIKGLKYVIYDIIPVKDWEKQECKMPYADRLKLLRMVINSQIAEYSKVLDIHTDVVYNFREAKSKYRDYLQWGYEGAILRRLDSLYKWGRSTLRKGELLKVKPFQSVDLKVVEFYEGEGQFEESLGGIICRLDNGNTVRIGSGFSSDARQEVWTEKEKYLGKTAEIKFLEYTEDQNLRHPIFIRWRDDK